MQAPNNRPNRNISGKFNGMEKAQTRAATAQKILAIKDVAESMKILVVNFPGLSF